jgi:hypothetical protein
VDECVPDTTASETDEPVKVPLPGALPAARDERVDDRKPDESLAKKKNGKTRRSVALAVRRLAIDGTVRLPYAFAGKRLRSGRSLVTRPANGSLEDDNPDAELELIRKTICLGSKIPPTFPVDKSVPFFFFVTCFSNQSDMKCWIWSNFCIDYRCADKKKKS